MALWLGILGCGGILALGSYATLGPVPYSLGHEIEQQPSDKWQSQVTQVAIKWQA
jgi:hypothetical protein